MKSILLGSALSACMMLTGCVADHQMGPIWPFNDRLVPAAVGTNADILGELIVINKAEIAAADVAKMKSQNTAVKNYARYLHAQHTKCLHDVMDLSHKQKINPVMNTTAVNLQHHANQELARLKTLNNADFDRAYINDAIQDHEAALRLIDHDIAQATNPQLVQALKDIRTHVAMHLQKAKAVMQQLNSH